MFRALAFSRATKEGVTSFAEDDRLHSANRYTVSHHHSPALRQRRTWVARLVVEQPEGFEGKEGFQQVYPDNIQFTLPDNQGIYYLD
jgi:hypothetical protein